MTPREEKITFQGQVSKASEIGALMVGEQVAVMKPSERIKAAQLGMAMANGQTLVVIAERLKRIYQLVFAIGVVALFILWRLH